MKTAPLFSLALLFASGCGTVDRAQPDGGRDRASCATDFTSMAIRVVDDQGMAMEGATVTATNAGLNVTQTGLTDSNGTTLAVNQDIGQGSVTVRAILGTRVTESKNCTWTCSDQCLCAVEPKTITLTLSP